MAMSKKDFIALADAIAEHNRIHNVVNGYALQFQREHLRTLEEFCAAQNPRFMRQRWLDYIAGKCGRNGGRVTAA